MREWSAEVAVDEELARRLVRGQFPEVGLTSLRLVGEGWDTSVWLADERWVFRFPRRRIAVPGVEREIAFLPRLAPLLPLPIPEPQFAGRPAEGYPWPFFGAPFLPGREAADADLTDAARVRIARTLAEFLRALHSTDLPGAEALPIDPMGRGDMSIRVPRTSERLEEVGELGLWRPPPIVARLLDDALRLPPPKGTSLAHGDLHFRHVLVDETGAPTGIIDWVDLCRADPAIDLVLLWSFLPPEGRREFLRAYGRVSEEQLLRARVLALFLCATLAVYGRHEGMANVEREAIAGLVRTTA